MKKIMMSFTVVCLFFLVIPLASAWYEHSGVRKGPDGKIGYTTTSGVHQLSTYKSKLTVEDCSVIFSRIGYLNSGARDNSRKMVVQLMDQDEWNGDDLLKSYTFSFNGLQIVSVSVGSYNGSQLVDDSSDKKGELYLRQTIDYRAGDTLGSNHGEMYYYDIQVS